MQSVSARLYRPWGMRCFAVLMLGFVAWMYWRGLSAGVMPPGHPWSGLFFVMVSAQSLLDSFSVPAPHRLLLWVRSILCGVMLVAALLWAHSAAHT
jgi:hypothetical protein